MTRKDASNLLELAAVLANHLSSGDRAFPESLATDRAQTVRDKAGGNFSLGCPVFACTPDQFPDMMAGALQKGDINAWESAQGITTVRASSAE